MKRWRSDLISGYLAGPFVLEFVRLNKMGFFTKDQLGRACQFYHVVDALSLARFMRFVVLAGEENACWNGLIILSNLV